MAKPTQQRDASELRKDVAALTGLLGRLASTCGIPHHAEGLTERVEQYCRDHREKKQKEKIS